MRATKYTWTKNLLSLNQIKELNSLIEKSQVVEKDKPALGDHVVKTSKVKFVRLSSVHKIVAPLIEFCTGSNTNCFGFDLYPLTGDKILHYNIYSAGEEYSWHIDSSPNAPLRDIKLTCMLNCSEDKYEGGDLLLFESKEIKCSEFIEPGSAVVFPSYTNHKVTKVISGKRRTLVLGMFGPKFR